MKCLRTLFISSIELTEIWGLPNQYQWLRASTKYYSLSTVQTSNKFDLLLTFVKFEKPSFILTERTKCTKQYKSCTNNCTPERTDRSDKILTWYWSLRPKWKYTIVIRRTDRLETTDNNDELLNKANFYWEIFNMFKTLVTIL